MQCVGKQKQWAGKPRWLIPVVFLLLLGVSLIADLNRPTPIYTVAATGAVVLWYTHVTQRIRETTDHNTTFNAVTQIHSAVQNSSIYEARKYLHEAFMFHWLEAVKVVQFSEGSDIQHNPVNPDTGIVHLPPPDSLVWQTPRDEDALHAIHHELSRRGVSSSSHRPYSALSAVEELMLAFDAIFVPWNLGIPAAEEALRVYAPVLAATARFTLRFVALEMLLRRDRTYKWPYLGALRYLKQEGWLGRVDQEVEEMLDNILAVFTEPQDGRIG